jgi:hypothetical protein
MAAVRDSIPPVSAPVVPATRASKPPASPVPKKLDALSSTHFTPHAERPLGQRLRPALALLGAAMVIAMLDPIYAASTGEVLQVLGLRLTWFGGALLLLALGFGLREALRES